MLIGEYRHNIDAKGRLFIPAKFRERLGDEFIISRGLDKCICVYPMEEWERFTAKLEELPVAKGRRIRRYFYAGAYDGSVDAQGRVTITQPNREFAGFEKEVVVVGNRTHIELWAASEWDTDQAMISNEEIAFELEQLGI